MVSKEPMFSISDITTQTSTKIHRTTLRYRKHLIFLIVKTDVQSIIFDGCKALSIILYIRQAKNNKWISEVTATFSGNHIQIYLLKSRLSCL